MPDNAEKPDAAKTVESISLLLSLPPEITVAILARLLHARDILVCTQTCKQLHALVTGSVELQYSLALASYGMREGAATGTRLSTTERLEYLRANRAAWRRVSIAARAPDASIPLPGFCRAYDFVGGRFVKSTSRSGDLPETNGDSARRLVFATLPSRHGAFTSGVETHDFDLLTKRFALDPSQDLLVLLETPAGHGSVLIHPRRLSKPWQTHPAAALPVLEGRVPGRVFECTVDIADDVIAFWTDETAPHVLVFNWRSGKLLVTVTPPPVRGSRRRPKGFSFVSPRSFMLTYTSKPAVELYEIPDAALRPCFNPVALSPSAALCLPDLAPNAHILGMEVFAGPWLADVPLGAAHAPRNDRRIHVLTLQVQSADHFLFDLAFVLHSQTFIEILSASAAFRGASVVDDGLTGVAPTWEHTRWLGTRARIVTLLEAFDWERYVHGARFIMQSQQGLHLYDFDVPRCAWNEYAWTERVDPNQRKGTRYAMFKSEPSVLDVRHLFVLGGADAAAGELPALVSSLPLSCVCFDPPLPPTGQYTGFTIDEERIIGIRLVDDGEVLDVWTI